VAYQSKQQKKLQKLNKMLRHKAPYRDTAMCYNISLYCKEIYRIL